MECISRHALISFLLDDDVLRVCSTLTKTPKIGKNALNCEKLILLEALFF